MKEEGFYYITLKSNNEFQINHFWNYKEQTPDESIKKVNEFLDKQGRPNIRINKFNSYEEANNILNQIVPYNEDGLSIDYELRKFYKYIMTKEEKDKLNVIINNFIEDVAYDKYNARSREGLKIKLNCDLKNLKEEQE